ncbi:ankyrin repeat domain-containing protein [Phaeosphaeriaceae sp. PMI808]|nr:ankyrin repeat domain-containing protein [Phaeosphaeriaceae sp. PMI808]
MDPLSVAASIIAILQLSAKVLAYLNDVKDASKGHAQCAIEASNLHNLLTNLRFRLEEGHTHQPWFDAVRALAVENGPLDQFKQALETLQTKITDGGRLKKIGGALIWKFKKEEVDDILARMERLKTLIEIALRMDHFKLSQVIKDDTDLIRTHASAIKSAVDKVQHGQATASQRMLLEWISSSDYPAQQSDMIKRRQEKTCQWFLDAPEVARWLNEVKTTLFCPGIPGAGKTMVAAVAVDHLLSSARNDTHGVAYVYCNYKSQADQDAASMLAAILKQLVQGRLSTLGSIEQLHQKHANRGTKPSLDGIYSVLRDVLAQYPYVYIVVDALDECQSEIRRQLLAKLFDLQKGADVRLMATSRFIPDVEDAFKQALRLEVQASGEDVKRFVAGQVYRLPVCIQRNAALQELVQEKIVEAVDGMFLLARLHIDSLLDKRTLKHVKSTLDKLSKDTAALDRAYGEALQRIEGQLDGDRELAKTVLTWITFAKRPLTTAEICCALAVEPGEAELDPENKPDVDDIVSVCAGLVVVDKESAIIRLVHYTTQEYFERVSSRLSPDGQVPIVETCLTYLSFSVFESGSCVTDEEFEERLRQHELLDYAAKHCGEHMRHVEAELVDLVCTFLTKSGLLSCATQVLFVPSYRYEGYSKEHPTITSLHWIARFGLCEVAKDFLRTTKEDEISAVSVIDSRGQGSLVYAVEHGHYEMAKLLLDKGADVDAQGGGYGNALQAASSKGHEQIVKLLLDKGADVNAQSGYHGNALQAASFRGHEQIVKLLLDKGADVNAQGGHYGKALQAASSKGHEQIVKLLLDKGADVNAQSGYHGNALQAASSEGHEQIAKLLLDKGADVNAQGGLYGNAIQAASYEGHEQIVKLLLDKGADVNAQGGDYGKALQAASYEGHEQIVKLLLDKGADVNAQGGDYGKALQAASYEGHEQIVKLLLDKGADVNVQGGFYGNALQAASFRGHEQIVKLLHKAGAIQFKGADLAPMLDVR